VAPCEVHILIWDRDHLAGLWAAKSFYSASGVDWPLFWHQGGALSATAAHPLRFHFPNSKLVTTTEADRAADAALGAADLGHLRAARTRAFMLRKLVDPVLVGRARHLLLLDSDVLFFGRPVELLDAVAADAPVGLFNRDEADWYTIARADARGRFGIELPERLNAGLGLVPRAGLDLARADRWLAAAPELLSDPWLTEQTLQALFAGASGVEFLPDTYRLSRTRGLTTADGRPLVAKHYVSHPRPLLFREGMPHLLRSKLLEDLRCRPSPVSASAPG